MWIIVLIPIIIINILLLIKDKRQLSHPGKLFNTYWIVNIIIGLLAFNVNVKWNGLPLIYAIIISVLFFAFFNYGEKIYVKEKKKKEIIDKEADIKFLLILCTVAGVLYSFLELKNNGFSIFYAVSNLREVGYYFTDGRYGKTELRVSFLEQVCLTINYGGFVLGGYCVKKKLLRFKSTLINFIPMVFSMITTTAKTVLISAILLWITGALVANATLNNINIKKSKNKSLKKYIRIISLILVIYIGFYYSFLIRYGSEEYTNINDRLRVYGLGHVFCFDHWLSTQEVTLFGQTHGYKFFYWLLHTLGIKSPMVNSYNFAVSTQWGWTNVHTAFADYIIDFGVIGYMGVICLLGGVCGAFYKKLMISDSPLSSGVVGLTYYCILYSFLVSPLRYLSIVGAYIVFGVTIYVLQNFKLLERKNKK